MTENNQLYTLYVDYGYGDGSVIGQGLTEDELLVALASQYYHRDVPLAEARELIDLNSAYYDNYYDPYHIEYGFCDPFEGVDFLDS